MDDTHLQIAVRDLTCIKDWFLVDGQKLLPDEELLTAKRSVDAAGGRRTQDKNG